MNKIFTNKDISEIPKPFIKWAGGKNWLINRIVNFIPQRFNNYHEPFLGGGAVFFRIRPKNYSFLADLNYELINVYRQIKKDPESIIKLIDTFEISKEKYYKIRAAKLPDKTYNAARFIYLNKTCYNGIYRVNSRGIFNVPYGHDNSVIIYDRNNLLAVSKALKKASLKNQDFENSLDKIEKHDLIFIDPPYTVAHNNNGFIEYNQKLFKWEDQERLADYINKVCKKGAFFILTNAVHNNIVNLYKNLGKRFELERHSTITSHIGKRKKISEYLFTNCI